MSSQNIMVVAVIAAVAIAAVALLVALLAVRRLRQLSSPERAPRRTTADPSTQQIVPLDGSDRAPQRGDREELQARVVEGRVVMTPTSRQIVDATMGRPIVKASILAHGLAHALRPESRDRIRALMRREYNRSRNQRRRAARQAVRTPTPGRHAATVDAHAWLGELPQRPNAPGELEVNR